MNNPAHMWKYWKGDKGFDTAVEEYYPDVFKDDPVLATNLHLVKLHMRIIDERMAELAGDSEE